MEPEFQTYLGKAAGGPLRSTKKSEKKGQAKATRELTLSANEVHSENKKSVDEEDKGEKQTVKG